MARYIPPFSLVLYWLKKKKRELDEYIMHKYYRYDVCVWKFVEKPEIKSNVLQSVKLQVVMSL